MTTKKPRADSVAGAVKAMVDAAKGDLQPPEDIELSAEEMLFWKRIVRSRSRDEWSDVDLVVAAHLAQCQSDISIERKLLLAEGRISQSARGTPVMNPRNTALQQLSLQQMALMRTLRMGGRVAGDPRDDEGKRKVERQSRKLRAELEEEDDGLLAT